MLSRWWLPVGEHLRSCMSDCGVCRFMLYGFLYCFLPPARPVYPRPYPPISPPVSVDISVLTPRYLRPSSFAFPLFLVSFSSLLPLFQLTFNSCSTPIPDSPARGFLSSFHPVCSFFDCRFSSFSLLFPSVSRPIRAFYVHKTYKKPSSQCSLLSRGGAGTGRPGHPLAFLGGGLLPQWQSC